MADFEIAPVGTVAELEKVRAERDALAAYVESVRKAYMPGSYDSVGERLLAVGRVLTQSPTTSIARRDARMKAEALESLLAIGVGEAEALLDHYRRQAEEGEG